MGTRFGAVLVMAMALLSGTAQAEGPAVAASPAPAKVPHHRAIRGRASYYARSFGGKTMADGKPLNLNSNAAASKTLPLGTTAKVTNLKNGNSAIVKIEDRGPYPPGRVIDVTPKVADKLDMKRDGVSPVKVEPLFVPTPAPAAGPATSPTTVAAQRRP